MNIESIIKNELSSRLFFITSNQKFELSKLKTASDLFECLLTALDKADEYDQLTDYYEDIINDLSNDFDKVNRELDDITEEKKDIEEQLRYEVDALKEEKSELKDKLHKIINDMD